MSSNVSDSVHVFQLCMILANRVQGTEGPRHIRHPVQDKNLVKPENSSCMQVVPNNDRAAGSLGLFRRTAVPNVINLQSISRRADVHASSSGQSFGQLTVMKALVEKISNTEALRYFHLIWPRLFNLSG